MDKLRVAGMTVVLGLGIVSAGCLGDENENLGHVAQAVAVVETVYPAKTDASHLVEIKIWKCAPQDAGVGGTFAAETECQIPRSTPPSANDFVMVGGGAEIIGEPSTGNPVLKASRPGYGFDTDSWIARSYGTASHQLRAYAIGIRLIGQTFDTTKAQRYIRDSTGSLSMTDSPATSGELLVGGGAEVLLKTDPSYVIESRPIDNNTWRGTINSSVAQVKVLSISLPKCPAGWGHCLTNTVYSATGSSATGYGVSSVNPLTTAWAVSAIGGIANQSSGSGKRYLHDLIPITGSNQGAQVRSKNVGTASGTTGSSALGVMVAGQPWQSNIIPFMAAGDFYKGSNGRLQQFGFPTGNNHRWYLEDMGGNLYHLRNGNPGDTTGSCAKWVSGTTVSIVTAANCTGSGALWEPVYGTMSGPFQLRNDSNSLCIDRDNFGYDSGTPRDVKVKSCVIGSNQQTVFLDSYNSWPY